jgi:hypothetical protein
MERCKLRACSRSERDKTEVDAAAARTPFQLVETVKSDSKNERELLFNNLGSL